MRKEENIKQLNKYGTILMDFVENSSFMQLGDVFRIEFVEDEKDSTESYNLILDITDAFTEVSYFVEINAENDAENDEFSFLLMDYSNMNKRFFNNFNSLLDTLVKIDKSDLGEFSF